MGNCAQCLRDGAGGGSSSKNMKKRHTADDKEDDLPHLSLSGSSKTTKNFDHSKIYTRITYEDAFPETSLEELLHTVDPESILTFQVHLKNFKLLNFNNINQEMFIGTEVGEDIIEKKQQSKRNSTMRKKATSSAKGLKTLESELQPETLLLSNQQSHDHTQPKHSLSDNHLSPRSQMTGTTRWESVHFKIGLEGSYECMETDNHFKFEAECGDIRKQFFIIQLYQMNQKKSFAYVSVEFLALALGPKRCDVEVRDSKTFKSLGRLQFEIDIKQYQTMGINLMELQCKLNGKEERPIFSQFKVITNNDVPRISDPTKTQIGRFKKEKNLTAFKWQHTEEDVFQHCSPQVNYDIAMETLKNSTIQMLLKVDFAFSEQQTEIVLKKIRKENITRNKTLYMPNRNTTKPQDTIDVTEIPLNGSMQKETVFNRQRIMAQEDTSINSNKMSLLDDEHIQPDDSMKFHEGADNTSSSKQDDNSSNKQLARQFAKSRSQSRAAAHTSSPDISTKAVKSGNRFSSVAADIRQGFQGILSRRHTQRKDDATTGNQGLPKSSAEDSSGNFLKLEMVEQDDRIFEELKQEQDVRKRSQSIRTLRSSVNTIDARDYYRNYDSDKDDKNESHSLIGHLVGECYVNFSKLLQSEMRQFDKRDSSILQSKMSLSMKKNLSIRGKGATGDSQRLGSMYKFSSNLSDRRRKNQGITSSQVSERKPFEESLWLMGKVVGTIKGVFQLQNIPVVQQMQLGILSEQGVVMNSAPILLGDEKDGGFLGILKKNNRNEQITNLIELTKRLKKIDGLKDKKQIYKTFNEKERILNDIISILSDGDHGMTSNQNTRMFKYSNELDMVRAQQAMIELGFHCLMYADNVRYEFKRDYYEILSQIFIREELSLTNVALCPELMEVRKSSELTFSQNKSISIKSNVTIPQKKSTAANDKKQILPPANPPPVKGTEEFEDLQFERVKQEKVRIAQYYQKLLYQILDDCLIKFCRKDVEPYLRSYLEICISIAFFRVPRFQSLFLECISGQNQVNASGEKVQITEWRNINWDIDEDEATSHGEISHGLVKLFDWQVQFYQHIPVSEEYQEAMKFIRRVENNKKWQLRVKKRSIAYFQIVRRWADFIQQTVQTNHLFWQDIPGYRIIVRSIILELKQRSITEYPDSLIEATMTLIQNPEILTVLMTIVFSRTNAYDSSTLCTTMGLVTKWLNHIEKLGLPFPSNFDFSFFLKGLTISLEIEHSVSTPKTLFLLYRTFHFFPIEQRSIIIQELFKRFLYTLFFNWSFNIRDLFIALMLYQFEYLYIVKTTCHLHALLESQNLPSLPSQVSLLGNDRGTTTLQQQSYMKAASQLANQTSVIEVSVGEGGAMVGEDISRVQMQTRRREAFRKLNRVVAMYEQQLQQNPNEAEENFDRSVSMRKFRVTADLATNHSMRQSPRAAQLSTNPFRVSEAEPKLSGADKRKISNQGLALSHFIKSYDYYRKFMQDLEVLEEYYTSQVQQSVATHETPIQHRINQSNNLRTTGRNENDIMMSGLSEGTSPVRAHHIMMSTSDVVTNNMTNSTGDLERRYSKIMQKIPQNLHIYVPQAIEDFNRQIEEFEFWKAQKVQSGAQQAIFFQQTTAANANSDFSILKMLPEFNLEKNLPVEDDENLEKKEEW